MDYLSSKEISAHESSVDDIQRQILNEKNKKKRKKRKEKNLGLSKSNPTREVVKSLLVKFALN